MLGENCYLGSVVSNNNYSLSHRPSLLNMRCSKNHIQRSSRCVELLLLTYTYTFSVCSVTAKFCYCLQNMQKMFWDSGKVAYTHSSMPTSQEGFRFHSTALSHDSVFSMSTTLQYQPSPATFETNFVHMEQHSLPPPPPHVLKGEGGVPSARWP